jgi:peptidyl-prolyl cis-trans isomerase SurA
MTVLMLVLLFGCTGGSDRAEESHVTDRTGRTASGRDDPGDLLGKGFAGSDGSADEVAASHILVAWSGARDFPADVQRTREQAEERARRIAFMLRTGRGELEVLARRYSDDPSAKRNGGYLGIFRRDEMMDALQELVSSLDVGEIGGPVITPYGWHVVRREPVLKMRLHHLLVAHSDALNAGDAVIRDKTEAARIAHLLRARLRQPDIDRCVLAANFSDDPGSFQACGDLGWIVTGLLDPEVERAIFALRPGEVSRVIETVYGFHVFWRP